MWGGREIVGGMLEGVLEGSACARPAPRSFKYRFSVFVQQRMWTEMNDSTYVFSQERERDFVYVCVCVLVSPSITCVSVYM